MNLALKLSQKQNPRFWRGLVSASLAEREGFEPPELLHSVVFKTTAIDHSAISPAQRYGCIPNLKEIKLFLAVLTSDNHQWI
jgi:hypothetical protein